MPGTYSYDPTKINDNGIDRMRFELGDTVVDMGEMTSPLCDEEYSAILSREKTWKRAKIACLKAIVMKFAYEVNTTADGLSYSFGQRYDRWKQMLESEKKGLSALNGLPIARSGSLMPESGEPYFYKDLHSNDRKTTERYKR